MAPICGLQIVLWLFMSWFVCFSECHLCLIFPRQRGEMDISRANSQTCLHHGQECGGIPPELPPKIVLEGGQSTFVKWQQNSNLYNIGYPGYMDIGFAVANSGNVPDGDSSQDPFEILAVVPDVNEYNPSHHKNYTAVVTIPNQDCDHCVIRVRYVSHKPGESIFYQCSDVKVKRSSSTQLTETGSNDMTQESKKFPLMEDLLKSHEEVEPSTERTWSTLNLNSGEKNNDAYRNPPLTLDHEEVFNSPFSYSLGETTQEQHPVNLGNILGLDRMLGKTVQIVREPKYGPEIFPYSETRSPPKNIKDSTVKVTDKDNGVTGEDKFRRATSLIKSSKKPEGSALVAKRSAPMFEYKRLKLTLGLQHASEQTQGLGTSSDQAQRLGLTTDSAEEKEYTPETISGSEHTPEPAKISPQINQTEKLLESTPASAQLFEHTVPVLDLVSSESEEPAPKIYGMSNEDENFVGATYYQVDITSGEIRLAGALDFNVDSPFKPQGGNLSGNYLANGTTNYVMDGVMTADPARRINVMPLNTFDNMDAVANKMIEIDAFTGQTKRTYEVYAVNQTKVKSAFSAVVVEIEDSYATFNIEPAGEEGKYTFIIGRLFKSGLWQELSRSDNAEDTYLSYQWSEYDIAVKTLYVLLGNEKDPSNRKSRLYKFFVAPGPPIVPGPCFCSYVELDMSQFPFMSFHVNWMNTDELFAVSPKVDNMSYTYPAYHLVTVNVDTGKISDVMQLTPPGIFERYYGGAIFNAVDELKNKIIHVLRIGDSHNDVITTIDVLKKSATFSQPTKLRHLHNLIYAWNV